MKNQAPYPKFAVSDDLGAPLSGGKVYTYSVGTSTPKTAYQDTDLTIAHANPIILNSRGEESIFLDGHYKIIITDSDGVQILSADDVTSIADADVSVITDATYEVEAERLTAASYATEIENDFVDIYTSDGDGTYTATPTTSYSALHHAAKANANRVLTNADVVLTTADAAATALDKVATNADVVLTHADVVLTTADAAATALDKIATNADVITTAASAAAALVSENNAAASESAAAATSASLAENPTTTTGLTWGWLAGQVRSDNVITDVAAGTLTLTDNATNYIEYSVILGMTINQSAFTSGRIPIRTVVTLAGVQTTSGDARAWLSETVGVGMGQAWVVLTGSRALGTTYYNTSGAPIMVVAITTSTLPGPAVMTIDGVAIFSAGNTTTGEAMTTSIIIPPAASYSLQVSSGIGTLGAWSELR